MKFLKMKKGQLLLLREGILDYPYYNLQRKIDNIEKTIEKPKGFLESLAYNLGAF